MQNRFKQSNLTKRINSKKFNIESIGKFDFERGLISKSDDNLYFTNFLKEANEQGYQLVEEYYIRFLENDYSFLDEFEVNEVTKGFRADRLLKIIKLVQKAKYKETDLPYIIKLNSVRDKRFHLYIRVNKNNLSLILIDIYHLGIFGEYYVNNKPQNASVEKIYKRHKNNSINLSEFKS